MRVRRNVRALLGALLMAGVGLAHAESITLDQALARAVREGTEPRTAAIDAEAASAEVTTALARTYNPELSAAIGPAHGSSEKWLDFEVALSQTFELGGKRQRRRRAAGARLSAAQARRRQADALALAHVRRAFVSALIERSRLDTASEGEAVAIELQQAAEERIRRGAGTQLEVNLASAASGRARRERLDALRRYESARGELAGAIGASADAELEPVGTIPTLPAAPDDLAGLLESARRSRAELAAARQDRVAAEGDLSSARAVGVPDVTLSVSYGRAEGTDVVLFGAGIALPIFDRTRGPIAAARAGIRRATLVETTTAREIEREVRLALRSYRMARDAVLAFDREVVDKLDENLELARQSLTAGKIGLYEFNQVRRDLFETRFAYLDALADAVLARLALEAASGVTLKGQP